MKKTKEKIMDNLKYHLVDSTALLVSSHPIFCAFETMVAGMSDDISINTRLYITGLTYAGLGWVVGKGRDLSKRLFNITDETKERFQQIYDSGYLAAINLPLGILLYTAAGETDVKKIAIGTGMGMAFGAFMGPLIGYSIDSFRDLTGMRNCERRTYPKFIRKLKPKVKKGLVVGLIAASIGTMGLIYSLTPDRLESEDAKYENLPIQQTISNANNKSLNKSLEQTILIDYSGIK